MFALRLCYIRTSHYVKERNSLCTRDADVADDGGMGRCRGGVSYSYRLDIHVVTNSLQTS